MKTYSEFGQEVFLPDKQPNAHQRAMKHLTEQRAKAEQITQPVEKKPTQEEVDAIAERLHNGDETAEQEAEELLAGKTKPVKTVEPEKKEVDQNELRNAFQNEKDAMRGKGSTPFLYGKLKEKYRAMGLRI